MIVQCEQCNTRFKLDDSKVREEGVKVRCSKCRHIFIVKKELPEHVEEADFDALLSGLIATPHDDFASTAKKDGAQLGESPVLPEYNETSVVVPPQGSEFGSADLRDDFSVSSFELEPEQPTSNESVSQETGTPFGSFHPKGVADLEYSSDFSFGESSDEAEVNKVQELQNESNQSSVFEEKLTSFSPNDQAVSSEFPFGFTGNEETVETESPEGISSDVSSAKNGTSPDGADIASKEDDSFAAISWDFAAPVCDSSKVESVEAPVAVPEPASESKCANSIPTDKIPLPESQNVTSSSPIAADDELPPYAIASRRRGSSMIPVVITAISVLVIIALAGAGFFMLNKGPTAFDTVGLGALVRWVGLDKGEEGSIEIRNSTSEFLKNKELGEIFVIRGEAVNAFRKPRASIQVKATLYGAKGSVVGSRTSYCGNPLTKEQLTTLSLVKIESAMGNQFGDSLANLGIQPGKAIPFVIVLTNVPADASEFGLEVVGSTVASQ